MGNCLFEILLDYRFLKLWLKTLKQINGACIKRNYKCSVVHEKLKPY